MTLKQLRDRILTIAAEQGSTGLTADLATQALEDAHRQRCGEDWNFMLWPATARLEIAPGQRYYSLHPRFSRPLWWWSATEQNWVSEVRNDQLHLALGMNPSDIEGPTTLIQLFGRVPVAAQPPAPSLLSVEGDADLHVVDANGNEETIEGGSTGAVEFSHIVQVTKVEPGDATLKAGDAVLLELPAGQVGKTYQQVWLPEAPTSPQTLHYRFYKTPSRFQLDSDLPDIPEQFSPLLMWDALIDQLAGTLKPDARELDRWREARERILTQLEAYDRGGQSMGALPNYTTYIER